MRCSPVAEDCLVGLVAPRILWSHRCHALQKYSRHPAGALHPAGVQTVVETLTQSCTTPFLSFPGRFSLNVAVREMTLAQHNILPFTARRVRPFLPWSIQHMFIDRSIAFRLVHVHAVLLLNVDMTGAQPSLSLSPFLALSRSLDPPHLTCHDSEKYFIGTPPGCETSSKMSQKKNIGQQHT